MSTEKQREQAFVEEVKKTLQEKGEKLDPEIMIKLSSIRSGVIESRGNRFFGLWRMARVPAAAFMFGTSARRIFSRWAIFVSCNWSP